MSSSFSLFVKKKSRDRQQYKSHCLHRKSTRLEEMSDVKQTGGKGESEEDKQSPVQEKRTCTTKNLCGIHHKIPLGRRVCYLGLCRIPPSMDCVTQRTDDMYIT
jgi:hypothetical protein